MRLFILKNKVNWMRWTWKLELLLQYSIFTGTHFCLICVWALGFHRLFRFWWIKHHYKSTHKEHLPFRCLLNTFALEIFHLISIDESAYQTMLSDWISFSAFPFVLWPVMFDLLSQKAALMMSRTLTILIVPHLFTSSLDHSVLVYFMMIRFTLFILLITRLLYK